MTDSAPAYACIEAGGTKFVVGVARAPGQFIETARFPTQAPASTLASATTWLQDAASRHGGLVAAGIASFGPVELDRASPRWGFVGETPKPGWSNTDMAGTFGRALGVPVGLDTDVNGAALAECRWGAARGQRVAVYLTVGTGIGGGVIVDGRPVCGLSHPEIGHLRTPRHPDDSHPGSCPFHGDCIEGLASGPAIIARWGASLANLAPDHPAHDMTAWYIAQLVVTLQATLEPGRIVVGGGVGGAAGLLDRVRGHAVTLGNGYFRGDPREIVVAPQLGDLAGLNGALALAMDAA